MQKNVILGGLLALALLIATGGRKSKFCGFRNWTRCLLSVAVIVVLVLASAQIVRGASFGLSTSAGGFVTISNANPTLCTDSGTTNASCSRSVSKSVTAPVQWDSMGNPTEWITSDGAANGMAAASALIGAIGATASVGVGGHGFWDRAQFIASAGFWDTITISQQQAGSGYLQINAMLFGTLAASQNNIGNWFPLWGDKAAQTAWSTYLSQLGFPLSGPSVYGSGAAVDIWGPSSLRTGLGFDSFGGFSQYGQLPGSGNGIPLQYQVPYSTYFNTTTGLWSADATFSLGLSAYAGCLLDGQGEEFGSCAADSSFGDTLQVTGLQLLDSNYNPMSGASWVAASGYDYNNQSSVPEPATMLLLGLGLVGLAGVRRKFKQ